MERMGRLRRSLRDSFRKKREAPESSKPHQWQADEEAVKGGNSSFHVKYLGSVEVFESRGMPVCEEAMKVLRQSRRRPVKSILHVSGDGLRLVEDETKGLILDQTIEKVSFCAPDRNHERGFSYICRDGTTRRWMCHGFLATKDSGERLSHAVGCAFAACLERKQKREKECGVSMTYDSKTSTFTRSGSFRTNSLTDSLSSNSSSPPPGDNIGAIIRSTATANTHAIERPHAPVKMLERQGSFRGFTQLANHSPFKRQLSLRLNDLPSNLQRTHQQNYEVTDVSSDLSVTNGVSASASTSPAPPPRNQRARLNSLPNNPIGGGGDEERTGGLNRSRDSGPNLMRLDSKDLVMELCQQVTQGLSLLAANHDEEKNGIVPVTTSRVAGKFTNPWNDEVGKSPGRDPPPSAFAPIPNLEKSSNINQSNFTPPVVDSNWTQNIPGQFTIKSTSSSKVWTQPISSSASSSPSKLPLSVTRIKENVPVPSDPSSATSPTKGYTARPSAIVPVSPPSTTSETAPTATRPQLVSAMSVQQPPSFRQGPTYRGLNTAGRSQSLGADPFDADWANSAARTGQTPTNPFARQPQQTFQISM